MLINQKRMYIDLLERKYHVMWSMQILQPEEGPYRIENEFGQLLAPIKAAAVSLKRSRQRHSRSRNRISHESENENSPHGGNEGNALISSTNGMSAEGGEAGGNRRRGRTMRRRRRNRTSGNANGPHSTSTPSEAEELQHTSAIEIPESLLENAPSQPSSDASDAPAAPASVKPSRRWLFKRLLKKEASR